MTIDLTPKERAQLAAAILAGNMFARILVARLAIGVKP